MSDRRAIEESVRRFEDLEACITSILAIENSTGMPHLMDAVDSLRKAQGQVAVRYFKAVQNDGPDWPR